MAIVFDKIVEKLPDAIRSYIQEHYGTTIQLPSRPDLSSPSNAGGLWLYAIAFVMMVIPLVSIFLESVLKDGRARSKAVKQTPEPVEEEANKPPTPPSTKISKMMVYPIKSCRGIPVEHTRLLRTGLEFDRNWMFVDDDKHKFLTIRENSQMTLIATQLTPDGQLVVTAPSKEHPEAKFSVPARPTAQWLKDNTELRTVTIWGKDTDAHVYAASLTAGFTELFGRPVRFALKGPKPRVLGGNGSVQVLGREEKVNFPDVAPILVASEQSLKELNARLEEKDVEAITIERFRPNIIVEGNDPWNEDTWKTLEIASGDDSITLDVLSRCGRCQVPNVEPTTGTKHKKEPWTTLVSYRRIDKGLPYSPCFGMLCAPREETEISVGMSVSVTDTTAKHKYLKGFS